MDPTWQRTELNSRTIVATCVNWNYSQRLSPKKCTGAAQVVTNKRVSMATASTVSQNSSSAVSSSKRHECTTSQKITRWSCLQTKTASKVVTIFYRRIPSENETKALSHLRTLMSVKAFHLVNVRKSLTTTILTMILSSLL
jgi:hypothetical protein